MSSVDSSLFDSGGEAREEMSDFAFVRFVLFLVEALVAGWFFRFFEAEPDEGESLKDKEAGSSEGNKAILSPYMEAAGAVVMVAEVKGAEVRAVMVFGDMSNGLDISGS